jgi:hypothetical protein
MRGGVCSSRLEGFGAKNVEIEYVRGHDAALLLPLLRVIPTTTAVGVVRESSLRIGDISAPWETWLVDDKPGTSGIATSEYPCRAETPSAAFPGLWTASTIKRSCRSALESMCPDVEITGVHRDQRNLRFTFFLFSITGELGVLGVLSRPQPRGSQADGPTARGVAAPRPTSPNGDRP